MNSISFKCIYYGIQAKKVLASKRSNSRHRLNMYQKRIEYKILVLVFKALHNPAPEYLEDLHTIKQSHYSLRSSASTILEVLRTRTTHYGDRAFVHNAPVLWSKLRNAVQNIQCLEILLETCFNGFIYSELLMILCC